MRMVSRSAVAAVGAAATVLWFSTSAQADAVVSNGYAWGGFVSYGDKVWVEHFEGRTSSVEWFTDYGRSGSCSVTTPEAGKTCDYNMREDGTITLWVCTTGPGLGNDECSEPLTDSIGN
ncbi:hypothetical protein HTV45_25950 [Streptomyces sp. CHD11]|uniref:hypothetical protein n=1 Tax=Streptomyces sp. CHD11 TaxID=2741325 RepID=UPI001BFC0190|nr:hypothetical protein [Streptomyces sp. CHD11]MBT3154274.1 hypothetical protein [Streptomyces sp. CHD11]